jgi:hypothetical protein
MDLEIYEKYFIWCWNNSPEMFLDLLSASIPFIFSIYYSKSLVGKYLPLIIYSISIFLFEIINNVFAAHSINNHDIYLGFYLLETALLSWYFIAEIQKKTYTIILILISILVTIALIYNIFSEINLMNDFASTIQALAFISIALINYYHILSKSTIKSLINSPFFWVNSGIFIYFSGKLFVSMYIFEMMNIKSPDNLYILWKIVPSVLFFERLFLAIAIKKTKPTVN